MTYMYRSDKVSSRLAQLVERVTSTFAWGHDEVSRSSRLMGIRVGKCFSYGDGQKYSFGVW